MRVLPQDIVGDRLVNQDLSVWICSADRRVMGMLVEVEVTKLYGHRVCLPVMLGEY
jgi:hypothetical protein